MRGFIMQANLTDALPLTRALRSFFPPGRSGKPVHLSTAHRWVHRGIVRPDGERVRLEAIKVGGVTYVTPQAAERFIAALNADAPASKAESDADISRRAREASQALEKLGC